jgi:hypothetical protein
MIAAFGLNIIVMNCNFIISGCLLEELASHFQRFLAADGHIKRRAGWFERRKPAVRRFPPATASANPLASFDEERLGRRNCLQGMRELLFLPAHGAQLLASAASAVHKSR